MPRSNAQGGKGRVGVALDQALARQRLADEGETSERREEREKPPSGRLGLNRPSHRRRKGVLVLQVDEVPAPALVVVGVHLEPRYIALTVAKSNLCDCAGRGLPTLTSIERVAGEDRVVRRAGREIDLARLEPHDSKVHSYTERLDIPVAVQHGAALRQSVEGNRDDRSNAELELLLHRESDEDLVRSPGKPTGQQLDRAADV